MGEAHWSRFVRGTGTKRSIRTGTNGPRGCPLESVLGENIVDKERTEINGITRAEPKDIKAFQMNSEKVDSWHGIIISPT